ncbi:MAG TPA: methyltransferase domain-containing protein [Nannocystaceae bacterium]|nr:methyltransferase domain-containing protein [Nannocystaceae bacterium]
MAQAPTLRDERMARVIDREVAPLWHDRFARMLWRHLPGDPPGMVLDVHCGGGRTTAELLDRLPGDARVIALEPDPMLRELAKSRLAEWKDRVYLKAGDLGDVADMPAASYDLVVANLVLGEAHNLADALRELVRVTKPGARILATLPLDGTWAEAEDLYREVLREGGLVDAVRRLKRLAHLRPTGHELARAVHDAGILPHHFVIEQERFELLFPSGREFLFSPLVELGPLRLWKAILGQQGAPQEVFWKLKESVDTYFDGHVFAVTVVAGVLLLRVGEPGAAAAHGAAETAGEYWGRWPELDALWQAQERRDAAANVGSELDVEIDIEQDAPTAAEPRPVTEPATAPPSSSMSAMSLTAEDEAIFALLDQPTQGGGRNEELDALLDQVLEFAGPRDDVEELEDTELEEIDPSPKRPGDTLSRIKALLPPPPGSQPYPPPPPGRRRR